MGTRVDGRNDDELRPVKVSKDFIKYPEGSVLFEQGNTKVLCNVTVEEDVPHWMKNSGRGWVTAEYAMLPRATHTRNRRERNYTSSRNVELSRLIGRALRPVVDMDALGPVTIRIDCDVIQADGGTRCASITGAYIALKLAERWMLEKGVIQAPIILHQVAAISVGVLNGVSLLDLKYEEDKDVGVDMNVIMTDTMEIIEIQGTAEHKPINRIKLVELLDLAEKGLKELFEFQQATLK